MAQSSKEYYQAYYQEHKEHKKSLSKDWYEKNKDSCKQRAANWVINNPEKRMLVRAKYRAKQKELEFNITIEDILIPTHCPILGIELVSHFGKGVSGPSNNSPSLDRINNNLGYIKGNVQVISAAANTMKMNKECRNG